MIRENFQEFVSSIRFLKKETERSQISVRVGEKSTELDDDIAKEFQIFRLLDPRFVAQQISDFTTYPANYDKKCPTDLINLSKPIANLFEKFNVTKSEITFFVDDDLLYFTEQNDLAPYDDEIVRIVFF